MPHKFNKAHTFTKKESQIYLFRFPFNFGWLVDCFHSKVFPKQVLKSLKTRPFLGQTCRDVRVLRISFHICSFPDMVSIISLTWLWHIQDIWIFPVLQQRNPVSIKQCYHFPMNLDQVLGKIFLLNLRNTDHPSVTNTSIFKVNDHSTSDHQRVNTCRMRFNKKLGLIVLVNFR